MRVLVDPNRVRTSRGLTAGDVVRAMRVLRYIIHQPGPAPVDHKAAAIFLIAINAQAGCNRPRSSQRRAQTAQRRGRAPRGRGAHRLGASDYTLRGALDASTPR